jgi:hypothetical protein
MPGRMTREDLFILAAKHGWEKGKLLTGDKRDLLREELRQALTEADMAPTRVFEADGSFRPMRMDEAVENLLEELV